MSRFLNFTTIIFTLLILWSSRWSRSSTQTLLPSLSFGACWILIRTLHVLFLRPPSGRRIHRLQRFPSQIYRVLIWSAFLNYSILEARGIASFHVAHFKLLITCLWNILRLAPRFGMSVLPLVHGCSKSTMWNSWADLGPSCVQLLTIYPGNFRNPLAFALLPAGLLHARTLVLLVAHKLFRNTNGIVERAHHHFLLFKLVDSFLSAELYILVSEIYFILCRMWRIFRNKASVALFIFLIAFAILTLSVFSVTLFKKVMGAH